MKPARKTVIFLILLAVLIGGFVFQRSLPRSFRTTDICAELEQCGEVLVCYEDVAGDSGKEAVLTREAVQPLLEVLESEKVQYQGKLRYYGVPSYTLAIDPSEKDSHDPDLVLDTEGGALYVRNRDGSKYEYWLLKEADGGKLATCLNTLLG